MRSFGNPVSFALGAALLLLLAATWVSARGDRARRAVSPLGAAALVVWFLTVSYVALVLPWSAELPARLSLVPLIDTIRGLSSNSAENVAVATMANVALFAPLGVVVALLSVAKRERRFPGGWWTAVVAGLAVSIVVEAAQLVLNQGAVAADDLIANALGAGLGWFVVRVSDTGNRAPDDLTVPDLIG
ncbi:VanZ family protein [Actinokineospora alba]|nr:VanZ family protein [Actinokineospora alba]